MALALLVDQFWQIGRPIGLTSGRCDVVPWGPGERRALPTSRKTVATIPQAPDRRRFLAGRGPRRDVAVARGPKVGYVPGLLFLAPWLIGFTVLILGPMLASLYLSFTEYDLLSSPEWIGTRNYEELFTDDPRYLKSIAVTLTYVVLSVPLVLMAALGIALLLSREIRGIGIYRAIFYVPSLLGGSVAIAILWRQLFGRGGVVATVFGWFGVQDLPGLTTSPNTAIYTLVALNVWQFGAPMLIFIVGLKQIPREVYEAAAVDGAGRVKTFLRITLPLLSPVIFFNVVLQTISAFKAFTPAYVISGGSGAPADATLFYTLYLYLEAFARLHMGYASAMAWVLLVALGLLTALQFRLSRRWVYYSDEEGQ